MPFSFDDLIKKGKRHKRVSLEDSIRENINYLIMSHVGDSAYDKSLGFEMWDYDKLVFYHEKVPYYSKTKTQYKGLLESSNAKKSFNDNLNELITKNEMRLENITAQFSFNSVGGNLSVYQRLILITVNGIIKSTGMPLSPPYTMKIFFTPFKVETGNE